MKNKVLCTVLGLTLTLEMGITSMAAPVAVEGGGVFDAEYYAENNADVVAAAGTDFSALWQHYILFGVNEGRLPFATGTDWEYIQENGPFQSLSNIQTGSADTTTTEELPDTTPTVDDSNLTTDYVTSREEAPITTIMEDYDNGGLIYKENNTYATFYGATNEFGKSVNGYEWRVGKIKVDEKWNVIMDRGTWWYNLDLDGSSNWQSVEEDDVLQFFNYVDDEYGYNYLAYDEYGDGYVTIGDAWKYDVEDADGNIKTGYEMTIVATGDGANNYYAEYFLIPKGYTGVSTLTVYGSKLENDEVVKNEDDAHTFVVK